MKHRRRLEPDAPPPAKRPFTEDDISMAGYCAAMQAAFECSIPFEDIEELLETPDPDNPRGNRLARHCCIILDRWEIPVTNQLKPQAPK